MKKFHPMALLLKFEGYPPAVIASVIMHGCLFLFVLGRNVDVSDFVTIEDPVIVTATAIDVNPQRLRRLERVEQERVADQRRREQDARDARARQEREAQQERERQQARESEELRRQEDIARQRAAAEETQRQRQAEDARQREQLREQQRLAQQQAERDAATRATQEAQANQIASENLIVAEYAGIIREIISQNWQIPPSARNGMSAVVRLQLVPTGEMVAVNIVQSSGDDVFDRSVLQAVERADRFPELQDLDNAVFERSFRTFTLVFRPEDLLR
jgi:colicin import membrane protein